MKQRDTNGGAAVSVINKSYGARNRHLKLIKRCADKAARMLGVKGGIGIAVVDDPEMREFNSAYRNISRTTDVLAFEHGDEGIAGDMIISFETARRRAKLYGISIEDELKNLVVHGVAHLAGHTHKRKKEGEKMRAEELRVLRAVSAL